MKIRPSNPQPSDRAAACLVLFALHLVTAGTAGDCRAWTALHALPSRLPRLRQ